MKASHWMMSVILVATFFAGCSGNMRVENMIIMDQGNLKHTGETPLADNISVASVFINEGADRFGANSQKIHEALVASLGTAKLLAHNGKGLYKIKAHIVMLKPGFSSSSVAVQYTLIRKLDDKEIYTKLISSTGMAEHFDTPARKYERAIRNNIAMLIDRLYKLKMKETDG